MKFLIVEDEDPAALRLEKMIKELKPSCSLVGRTDSIRATVEWIKANEKPDLIFMDIQLADGLSFEIFQQIDIEVPVIFTTAFDQYALKAFKVNSIDYLLKPIDKTDLSQAISQYENLHKKKENIDSNAIQRILGSFQKKEYKRRFLIKSGDHFAHIAVEEIAYFYSEDSVLFLATNNGKKYIIEFTVDKLMEQLDPESFFRINRKLVLNDKCIDKISSYFNSRLKLDIKPTPHFEVVVAREKVKSFKEWLDS